MPPVCRDTHSLVGSGLLVCPSCMQAGGCCYCSFRAGQAVCSCRGTVTGCCRRQCLSAWVCQRSALPAEYMLMCMAHTAAWLTGMSTTGSSCTRVTPVETTGAGRQLLSAQVSKQLKSGGVFGHKHQLVLLAQALHGLVQPMGSPQLFYRGVD